MPHLSTPQQLLLAAKRTASEFSCLQSRLIAHVLSLCHRGCFSSASPTLAASGALRNDRSGLIFFHSVRAEEVICRRRAQHQNENNEVLVNHLSQRASDLASVYLSNATPQDSYFELLRGRKSRREGHSTGFSEPSNGSVPSRDGRFSCSVKDFTSPSMRASPTKASIESRMRVCPLRNHSLRS